MSLILVVRLQRLKTFDPQQQGHMVRPGESITPGIDLIQVFRQIEGRLALNPKV